MMYSLKLSRLVIEQYYTAVFLLSNWSPLANLVPEWQSNTNQTAIASWKLKNIKTLPGKDIELQAVWMH